MIEGGVRRRCRDKAVDVMVGKRFKADVLA